MSKAIDLAQSRATCSHATLCARGVYGIEPLVILLRSTKQLNYHGKTKMID